MANPNNPNSLKTSASKGIAGFEYRKWFLDAQGNPALRVGIDDINTVIDNTIVAAGDVGANYVAGSVGQIKTSKTYEVGALTGDPAKLVTYLYASADGPTKPTKITTTLTTV